MTDSLVTLADIRAAATRLRGVVVHTPLLAFPYLGRRILLKPESLQPIGAFKIRGAFNAIAQLSAGERAKGVITYSSGNHAQGVARAARALGVPAVVVMPEVAPLVKRRRVEADGAEVILVGPASEERKQVAERLAAERGLTMVPPYNDDRIIAGQGTVGLEIAQDCADCAAVLVPIGGGGLASGVAVALKALQPGCRVIGVEPALAADARESLAAGRIVSWPAEQVARTIADGARAQAIGTRTFEHLRSLLDGVVTVSEAEIVEAIRLAAGESRIVIEPTGALAVAAAAFRWDELGLGATGGPVVAVVSGGNVDPDAYGEYLRG